MVLFNHATREMTAKIVYYGPGLCGKTTNLMVIFDKLDPSRRGKMLSLATKTDRTLFFDLLPVDIGKIGNFNLKIQLYTVPGQVFYNETRKLVLKGADGVVFVIDSQPSMVESDRESFANLFDNLEQNHIDANDIPLVIQYNKRDIPGVLPVEELQEKLSLEGYPYLEASAIKGEGVLETFKLISKITAKHLVSRMQGKPSKLQRKGATPEKVEVLQKPRAEAESAPATAAAPFVSEPEPLEEQPPLGEGYEKMEEISLEQLLEGRDRPTLTGDMPLPVTESDIEELQPEQIIEPEPVEIQPDQTIPIAEPEEIAEVEQPPDLPLPVVLHASEGAESRIEELETEVAVLRSELDRMRSEHDARMDSIARGLYDLVKLVQR